MRLSTARLPLVGTLSMIAALFVAYTTLEFVQPVEPAYALLGIAVGIAGVAVLHASGPLGTVLGRYRRYACERELLG